ncbi:MAG: enoyl-CoA hydratase/isomerase family protein [Alphaproteobacteria bacterium]|nr:enoyl-CoA hydratase/isomerase family protein [Alphaproteobacteria bacterium]
MIEMPETSFDLVLANVSNNIGWLTLNRPNVLNALNLEMTDAIFNYLKKWQDDPTVHMVVIQGKGRAFCAGGDLRQVYQAFKKKDQQLVKRFFKHEYNLNRIIYYYPKPYIAILNGITMGGGMGLSIHGTHRIVTNNAVLAMPETSIGFFPDVGASHFLTRCPGSIGLYLGLTGRTIGPTDALYSKLATHYISLENLSYFLDHLADLHTSKLMDTFLNQQYPEASIQQGFLAEQRDIIDSCFNQSTLLDIFKALENHPSSFAQETLACLRTRSPLSLKLTFNLLKDAQNLDFHNAINEETKLCQKMIKKSDFMEGIRAAVIDKDRAPQWLSYF